jgi:transcriptional regulator with XRE-family HTH domain
MDYDADMASAGKLVSEQLRNAIEQSGQTRYAISKGTGVSEAQLSKFIHRTRSLDLTTVDKLATYLGLELTKKKG